jgi:Na+/H+ antiporter NhaD/arsenite permease-like protein
MSFCILVIPVTLEVLRSNNSSLSLLSLSVPANESTGIFSQPCDPNCLTLDINELDFIDRSDWISCLQIMLLLLLLFLMTASKDETTSFRMKKEKGDVDRDNKSSRC